MAYKYDGLADVAVYPDISDSSYNPGYAVLLNEKQIQPIIFSRYMSDVSKSQNKEEICEWILSNHHDYSIETFREASEASVPVIGTISMSRGSCYSTKYAILKEISGPGCVYGQKVRYTVEENGKLFASRSWALDHINSNKGSDEISNKISELEKQIVFLTNEVQELRKIIQKP